MLLKIAFFIVAAILLLTKATYAIPMEGKDSNSSEEDEKSIGSAEKIVVFEVKPTLADDVPLSGTYTYL